MLNSVIFSGKTHLKIIFKVTKKQCFTLSLETSFGKTTGGEGVQIEPPSLFRVNI